MHDVIIVGGGPAGLAAALTLGRSHRNVLVLDAGQGRNAPAAEVHNFFTNDGTPPDEVREIGRRQLARYPTVRIQDGAVERAERRNDGVFDVSLTGGETIQARRILLATGLRDELPPIDGLASLWGRSAFHCPYCHGYEASGRPIAVLGAAPGRIRLAAQLSRFSDDVVLCANGTEIDDDGRRVLESLGIAVHEQPVARVEAVGDQLKRIVFASGEGLDREAMFIPTELRQASDLAERLGCMTFPDGIVSVDEFGRTSVLGVFAAGDMARRATMPMPVAAVIAAAASGTIAAGALDQDLLTADTGLPDPFAKG